MIALAVGVWLVAAALPFAGPWRVVELTAFDAWTILFAPGTGGTPFVVVGIDEASFAELGLRWPWPRDVHARLIDSLAAAGAAVIAFDVVFSEPSPVAGADDELAAAIRRAGNVVLAGDVAVVESPHVTQRTIIEPLPIFLEAGAVSGIASVVFDGDGAVRRVPAGDATFWRQVLAVYARRVPGAAPPATLPADAMIRYAGPDHSFRFASYYQALAPAEFLPKDFFKDRIVLIGLDIKTSPDPGARQADMFATPFLMSTRQLMPGVEVQANIADTVLRGRVVREAPATVTLGLLLAVAGMAAWEMRRWQPVRSSLVAGGLALAVLGLAAGSFQALGLWLPVVNVVAGLALLYVAEGGLAFLRERALRQQIKRTFTHYVSPQVVEQMIAHPEQLVLGGERRPLTLLFGDLAGFTTLAERLGPEQVVQLLNRALTETAAVVVQHGGTVDKFMGDAIMAFWGAPLADDEHALHACQAAVDMQAAVARVRTELATQGLPQISMRIGLNSGTVVVGNMGSATLFDYTAVGDDVNLASRLEGLNKVYGTEILVSAATASLVGPRLPFRPVDRVRVKGKAQAVDVFTVERDPAIVAATEQALAAYREQRWDDAEIHWKDVLALRPDDPVAEVYRERIAHWRQAPPPPDWDAAYTAESK
jgi:adenylate cyclase